MKIRLQMAALLTALVLPAAAHAADQTWKNVSLVDTHCVDRVKAKPDEHTVQCALQCQKGGYGILTPEGAYLRLDAAGNARAVALLKDTKKTDHIRATVVGEQSGETVKVTSIALE